MILNLTEDSLRDLLENHIGIKIVGETGQDFIAYCPFHLNNTSAAFNIGKHAPYPWRCWNTACGVSGTLPRLVEVVGEMQPMEALRFIAKFKTGVSNLDKLLERNEEAPYEPWPLERLEGVRITYDSSDETGVVPYLIRRGFTLDTLEKFQIGYSKKKDRVVIPVWDDQERLVGFSGRALRPDQEPRYWDKGLPKKFILYNLNKAKQYRDVIVVEGPLDAMKVDQAGFPNVVAIFGGGLSHEQADLLTRNFSSCIIFTDNPDVDEAGAALAFKLAGVMKKAGRQVYVARYPQQVKDPGDMSEEQIKYAIENAESVLKFKLRIGGIVK